MLARDLFSRQTWYSRTVRGSKIERDRREQLVELFGSEEPWGFDFGFRR
jgi:hypothetical protein